MTYPPVSLLTIYFVVYKADVYTVFWVGDLMVLPQFFCCFFLSYELCISLAANEGGVEWAYMVLFLNNHFWHNFCSFFVTFAFRLLLSSSSVGAIMGNHCLHNFGFWSCSSVFVARLLLSSSFVGGIMGNHYLHTFGPFLPSLPLVFCFPLHLLGALWGIQMSADDNKRGSAVCGLWTFETHRI